MAKYFEGLFLLPTASQRRDMKLIVFENRR